MEIEIVEKEQRTSNLFEVLVEVWTDSVQTTHDFLSESDRVGIAQEVPAALAAVEHLAVMRESGLPVAFVGARNGKLEMLFVSPSVRGCNVGHRLLSFAVQTWGVHRLDVNEQNLQACGFYQHEGFAVVARSKFDGAGRPFPLLHMERAEGIRAQMASGEWFDDAHPQLRIDQAHIDHVLQRFNSEAGLSECQRMDLLRGVLGACGERSLILGNVHFDYGYHIFIGTGCFINYNSTFLDGAPIIFGDDVWVGPGCTFVTPLHPLLGSERAMRIDEDGTRHLWERNRSITVGSNVWLASGVTVNPGVTIGEGCVIGSGSVVTKDIAPHMLAFGNPCRTVREITEADSIAEALAEAGLT